MAVAGGTPAEASGRVDPACWPKPDWRGETAVVIGSGPSLTQEQVDYVRGKARVIVVNNNYQLAPWADVLYAVDAAWWDEHPDANDFAGLKLCGNGNAMTRHPNVQCIKVANTHEDWTVWTPEEEWLPNGGNGGFQATALAIRFGVACVVLLGFDMREINGRAHWHADHVSRDPKRRLKNPVDKDLARWANDFRVMAGIAQMHGVEIINCTPSSRLDCFPMRRLEDVL